MIADLDEDAEAQKAYVWGETIALNSSKVPIEPEEENSVDLLDEKVEERLEEDPESEMEEEGRDSPGAK